MMRVRPLVRNVDTTPRMLSVTKEDAQWIKKQVMSKRT
jgi:hypothetical protein